MQRGFSMLGTLGFSFLILILLLVVLATTENNRRRLSQHKHQEAAYWLAVSGADLFESRLNKGGLKHSDALDSPELRNGTFKVRIENGNLLVSQGKSAGQTYTLKRKLGSGSP